MTRTSTSPRTRSPLIRFVNGRPVIFHNGKPVPEAAYSDYITWSEDYEGRIREFAENGVRVFHVATHPGESAAFWGFPEAGAKIMRDWPSRLTICRQVDTILKFCPDALLFIRPSSTVDKAWAERYPHDMQTDEDGKRYADATLASSRYLQHVARFFQRLVNHCESQPWGDRIVGYLDAPYGEGTMPLVIAGKMFDCSRSNERAFREWIRERYGTQVKLRKAWGNRTVTFDKVRVPRDRDWLARKAAGPATIKGVPIPSSSLPSNAGVPVQALFHWTESTNVPVEQDYCRFQRDQFLQKFHIIAQAIKDASGRRGLERLVGFDVTKQPLMGWQILSSFDGIGDGQSFPNLLLLSGSWHSEALLDDPAIDVIFTPADYHARTVGFAYEAEGVSDSLLLRDKAMIIENDARSWVGQGSQDQGAFRTPKEAEAGLLRNAGLTLSRRLQSYWCNVGSSYFHAPELQKIVGKLVPLLNRASAGLSHRETRDAVAFVIDDESLLTEDLTSGYQTLSVIWQRVLGLAHCGVPYRLLLLSDLKKTTCPAYKTWFFPNLFVVNAGVMKLLRKTVLRDGNLAIFGPSSGISDGRFLNAKGASQLLGVPMELFPRTTVRHVIVQDNGHPITRDLPASESYGDSLPYGPTLMPVERGVEKAGGVPLGHATACWFIHRTGLFLKEEGRGAAGNGKPGPRGAGDYAVLWSCAMPLPADLIRAACRYAGSHVWCEEDDVIYASESLVCLHSVKAGRRVIRLPRPRAVVDAITGRLLGKGMGEIRVTVNPPATFIFLLNE